jgi:ribulose-bisphosphate carboxylase large chain
MVDNYSRMSENSTPKEYIQITYYIDAKAEEVTDRARAILLEQTVETPASVAERYDFVRENMMGHLDSVVQAPGGGFYATMSIPTINASTDSAQLINSLFGNVSLYDKVRLHDLTLPPSIQSQFTGPKFGIAGIREILGVSDRPLAAAAIKPVGLSVEMLANLCRTFAEGGIDVIKEDHYLASYSFCPFEERVKACQAAVEEVAEKTGHQTIYAPNLSGTPEQVLRQAEFVQKVGVKAVLGAPMLLGMPFFYELTQKHLSVPILAHPSFAGNPNIPPDILLGKLFRLFGADAVIFPNYGGRFSYSPEVCQKLAETLREPWGNYRSAFPIASGGMTVERAPELVNFFGNDVILLIGGSLLQAGDKLLEKTREFTKSLHQ